MSDTCSAYQMIKQVEEQQEEIPISHSERAILGSYAVLTGIDGISLLSTGLWFMTTPSAAAGLGASLTGLSAALAITGVGLAVVLIALPIACFTYNAWLNEAENLQKAIQAEHLERKKRHEILFFELLKLRCNYKSALAFEVAMQKLRIQDDTEIYHDTLIKLVNETFQKFQNKHYSLEWNAAGDTLLKIEEKTTDASITFSQLIKGTNFSTQDSVRQAILAQMEKNHFQKQFAQCFKSIPALPIANQRKAIAAGVIAGLTTAVITLGTAWTFSSLLIGAGLAASIPVLGWAILAAGCLVLGAIAGAGMYMVKQKNIQREQLKTEINNRNTLLTGKIARVTNASLQLTTRKARETHGFLPPPSPKQAHSSNNDENHNDRACRAVVVM